MYFPPKERDVLPRFVASSTVKVPPAGLEKKHIKDMGRSYPKSHSQIEEVAGGRREVVALGGMLHIIIRTCSLKIL